jgi:chromosomal replication initiation ATPase DnaA
MAEQLVFEWPAGVSLGPDDFFVSDANRTAFTMLLDADSWPEGKLVLCGPKGSGKSHLARVFQGQTDAVLIKAADLDDAPPPAAAIIIEDLENLAPEAETALFHLHNHQKHAGLPLLMTAQQPPARWSITLPDLASRMQATTVALIQDPDDDLLTALILKLFTDRQITPPLSLASYLARRIERSFAAAAQIVADLDAYALREGKPINQRMAASLLDKQT